MATKTLTNVSSNVLQINDLGDKLVYEVKPLAQSVNLAVGANVVVQVTDFVNMSILKGDIKKFVDAGKLTVA